VITHVSVLAIQSVLLCGLASEDAQKAHLSLKAYTTGIRVIHIQYTETWEASSIEQPFVKKVRDAELQDLHAKLAKKYGAAGNQLEARMREQLKFKKTTVYDLLETFPLCRLETRVSQERPTGTTETEHVIRYVKSNKLSVVDLIKNRVGLEQNPGVVYTLNTPLNALGLRLRNTLNKPMYDLLEGNGNTIIAEGNITIKGVQTLVISTMIEGSAKLKLYLAPVYSYLPVRSVFSKEVAGVWLDYVYELSEFEQIIDQDRKRLIPFPRLITFTDPAGTWTWKINGISINQSLNHNEFDLVIPKSALVYRGKEAPIITLGGGPIAHAEVVKKTVKEAEAIIADTPPPAAEAIDYTTWFVGAMVVFLMALGALLAANKLRYTRSTDDAT
jgi:hypothetical protein